MLTNKFNGQLTRSAIAHIISLMTCSISPGIIITGYFFGAALLASSLDSIMRQLAEIFLMVTFVAAAHALLLGLPLYLLIQRYSGFTYKIAAVCGFIVGMSPLAVFTWPLQYLGSNSSSASNGVQTMLNGVPTIAGWLSYLLGLVAFGFLGLAGALVFKFTLSKLNQPNHLMLPTPSS